MESKKETGYPHIDKPWMKFYEGLDLKVARNNNLYCYKDDNNNIYIRKNGREDREAVLIQAHLDMVCVSSNNYDFSKGIDVIIDGNEIRANGTSLGADQGIGLAYMLTLICDNNEDYPTMEFLFTSEEETTFNGACSFDYSKIISKRMINLDNAREDTVYIGSDADICNCYSFNLSYTETNKNSYRVSYKIDVGGNSGENIDSSTNNAIYSLINLLKDKDIFISSINGGVNANDIADFCYIDINTDIDLVKELSNACISIEKIDNNYCLNEEDTKKLIDGILKLKSGYVDDGISANLGMVETINNILNLHYICRCLDSNRLDDYVRDINDNLNNFVVKRMYDDSCLIPIKDSYLLSLYKDIYYSKYNSYPKEEICHGGNECACISKYSNIKDIISIGPNIEYFHTVKEKTYIDSILRVYDLLVKMLKKIK